MVLSSIYSKIMTIACIGGAHLDRHGVLRGPLIPGTSNRGDLRTDFGGVAGNVAENLARLGRHASIVTRVGDDQPGRQVTQHLAELGVDTSMCEVSTMHGTASYTAILERNGELVVGLADADIYEELDPPALERRLPRLREHDYWFVDTNIPAVSVAWLLSVAGEIPVAVDAVSVERARGLRPLLPRIPVLFANVAQAAAMVGVERFVHPRHAANPLRELGARAGIVTGGSMGIAVWWGDNLKAFPALEAQPRDVTGAGDALVAGTLFGLSQWNMLPDAAQFGLAAAAITVESEHTRAPELSAELLHRRMIQHGRR